MPADGRRAVFLAAVVGERRQQAVAAQVPAVGEAADVAHLRQDGVGQDEAHPRQAAPHLARRTATHLPTQLARDVGDLPAELPQESEVARQRPAG